MRSMSKLMEKKFFQTLGFLKCSARHVECRFNKAADTTSTKGRNFLVQGPILRNKQVFRTTILPQTFPLDKDIAVSTSLPEVLRYISKNFTLNDRKKIRCQFFYKKDRFFLQNLLSTSKMYLKFPFRIRNWLRKCFLFYENTLFIKTFHWTRTKNLRPPHQTIFCYNLKLDNTSRTSPPKRRKNSLKH